MAVDPRILDEAADWLVRVSAGALGDADQAALARWRAQTQEHAQAWDRAERLLLKMGTLPSALAMPALTASRRAAGAGRRSAVRKLALLALAPAAWLGWRVADGQDWTADHRTATGERRDLQLADGTRLMLSTASAVDVRFDAGQRLIRLRAGEILVQTAPDPSGMHRPLRVTTADGRMEALGTRFSVRQHTGYTRLVVLEGRVRVEPQGPATADTGSPAQAPIVQAGQQMQFTAGAAAPAMPADDGATAWTRGMLLADRMALADVVAEIARWRGGIVRCDPAVAGLRVSGAFPLADTGRALSMLAATYPVAVVDPLGGRWITLVAR